MTWFKMILKKENEANINKMIEEKGYPAAILFCKMNGWKHQAQKLQQDWDNLKKQ